MLFQATDSKEIEKLQEDEKELIAMEEELEDEAIEIEEEILMEEGGEEGEGK